MDTEDRIHGTITGCGAEFDSYASAPGRMHWQCEVDRLRGLVAEAACIAPDEPSGHSPDTANSETKSEQ